MATKAIMQMSPAVAPAMACADVLALPMTGNVDRAPDLAVGGVQFPDESLFADGHVLRAFISKRN